MWGRSGSPLIVDDMVVVPFGGGKESASTMNSLIALDLATGEERWVGGKTQISYASPALLILDGVRQIVSVNEGDVTGTISPPGKFSGRALGRVNPMAMRAALLNLFKSTQTGSFWARVTQGSKLILVQKLDESNSNQQKGWQSYDQWADTRTLKTKFTNAIVFEEKRTP
jgi:hypothetical protein